ncbi:MAG: TIGR04282 family arsenosugar biosynthesis glycosyltransferase [Thermodesulfovibrionales bacterium]|nr:TIGR04282 family arsenosugar biosynthesis glycosyltransferase [Thermodesulfovibrionales bacterium]
MKAQALVIMAKAPEADNVKTRLKGSLTDDERVALYERLLCGTVERLRDIKDTDTFITYTPREHREYFNRFDLTLFAQEGDGLGPRMHLALAHVLGMGYERAALVGVDIPGLGPGQVNEAMGLLDHADVVFGPALDGGYYLVAMHRALPEVFEGIEWSVPDTLRQSLDRAAGAGLLTALGPVLGDVDTPEDLADLERQGLL